MALVTTMPVSIRIPIRPGSDKEVLVTTSAMIAPVAAKGIATSSTNGFNRERKVATMIRYTSPIAASRASANCVSTVESWAKTPPVESEVPAGSRTPLSASVTLL